MFVFVLLCRNGQNCLTMLKSSENLPVAECDFRSSEHFFAEEGTYGESIQSTLHLKVIVNLIDHITPFSLNLWYLTCCGNKACDLLT